MIENPAWTLFVMYECPPSYPSTVGGFPSKKDFRSYEGRVTKWYKDRIKNPKPPEYVQNIMFLVVLLITTIGLYILGYIGGNQEVILINITIIPFGVILLFLVNLIKAIIELVEFIVSICLTRIEFKFSQRIKFIIINITYIIIVYSIYSFFNKLGFSFYNFI